QRAAAEQRSARPRAARLPGDRFAKTTERPKVGVPRPVRDMGSPDQYGSTRLRDAGGSELVRPAARAAALRRRGGSIRVRAMPLLVAALLVAGCGGGDSKKRGLVWDEPPSIRVSPSGATVVIGRVRNESSEELSIR